MERFHDNLSNPVCKLGLLLLRLAGPELHDDMGHIDSFWMFADGKRQGLSTILNPPGSFENPLK
jgi:hypothetical protein